nr:hypothetical protein RKE32_00055 [Streptomyces sp. Li-HN-5-13]
MHAILEHQDENLTDDATIMMIEWQPDSPPLLDNTRPRTSPW